LLPPRLLLILCDDLVRGADEDVDHVMVPLNLLIFGLQVAITTATCVADVAGWQDYTSKQRADLYGLYLPYLVLGKSCHSFYPAWLR
jgi:hypothetical protein